MKDSKRCFNLEKKYINLENQTGEKELKYFEEER